MVDSCVAVLRKLVEIENKRVYRVYTNAYGELVINFTDFLPRGLVFYFACRKDRIWYEGLLADGCTVSGEGLDWGSDLVLFLQNKTKRQEHEFEIRRLLQEFGNVGLGVE